MSAATRLWALLGKKRIRFGGTISKISNGVEGPCDEVTSEGFDPEHSPLGPVYWRIINRGDERFYRSTFLVTRGQIINAWGTKGPAYRNPMSGIASGNAFLRLALTYAYGFGPQANGFANRWLRDL